MAGRILGSPPATSARRLALQVAHDLRPDDLRRLTLEPGDLFAVDDFRSYLETGKLKYPVATYYNKNGW